VKSAHYIVYSDNAAADTHPDLPAGIQMFAVPMAILYLQLTAS
jgi:hypothetical protein